jgi:hypothetical protein
MKWLNHKKSRAMDLFRKMDKDNDGRVLKDPDFIDGIIKSSKFVFDFHITDRSVTGITTVCFFCLAFF